MKSFEEFLKTRDALRENCPWHKTQDISSFIFQLEGEVKELKEAIDKDDWDEIPNEIGDVLWDLFCLIHMVEQTGKISFEEILEKTIKKFKFRSPHVFEGLEIESLQHLEEVWKERKNIERKNKIKNKIKK